MRVGQGKSGYARAGLALSPSARARLRLAVQQTVGRLMLLTGWNAKQCAEHLRLSPQTLSNWSNGRRLPTNATLHMLKAAVAEQEKALMEAGKRDRNVYFRMIGRIGGDND